MSDDAIDAATLIGLFIFAVILWIAAIMDTQTGVYPAPDAPPDTEIGTALYCWKAADVIYCSET